MTSDNYFSLKFEGGYLVYLDQTRLPSIESYITTDDYKRVAESIKCLEIRGAPLIGIAAAYALALSQKEAYCEDVFNEAFSVLASTRPTAVNLFVALNRMKSLHDRLPEKDRNFGNFCREAMSIHREDELMCEAIAQNGADILPDDCTILTHCNTGKLATGGIGTAFGIIRRAFEQGKIKKVYADETRPLFQGLRLTSFELHKTGIPYTIITESTAGVLIRDKKINAVITGADRIARNGDAANKLGTFTLSVLCKHHGIPFFIAAPSTTIDLEAKDFSDIPIEERKGDELLRYLDETYSNQHFEAYNPSFDVTPAENIDGIITEKGVFRYPFSFK